MTLSVLSCKNFANRDAHVKRFTRPTFLARLNLLWGFFSRHDENKSNMPFESLICILSREIIISTHRNFYGPRKFSTLKDHKFSAQKWIYHCKFEKLKSFEITMLNPLLRSRFVIFEVGRIFQDRRNFLRSKLFFILKVYTSSFQTAYLIYFYHVLKKNAP